MKLHERTMDVQKAEAEIRGALWNHPCVMELTAIELTGILIRLAGDASKLALRQERHPDLPNKNADEA